MIERLIESATGPVFGLPHSSQILYQNKDLDLTGSTNSFQPGTRPLEPRSEITGMVISAAAMQALEIQHTNSFNEAICAQSRHSTFLHRMTSNGTRIVMSCAFKISLNLSSSAGLALFQAALALSKITCAENIKKSVYVYKINSLK